MIIIDAQVHIWPPATPHRPYIKEDASKPHRLVPLGPEELLREMESCRRPARDLRAAFVGRMPQRFRSGSGAFIPRPFCRHG